MNKKSIRFAAVAAVLLAFCLVFMMPVGAEECNGDSCSHVAAVGDKHYSTLQEALNAAKNENVVLLKDITVDVSNINGAIHNAEYSGTSGTSQIHNPYADTISSYKVLMGTADEPAEITLTGSYTGSQASLLSGKLTVKEGAGLYGSDILHLGWMNYNKNGNYKMAVGNLLVRNTNDDIDVTFNGDTPIAQLDLESGAEISRFGKIYIGSGNHNEGENAYVLNIPDGATLEDFGELSIRGDGTVNVGGDIDSYSTTSYHGHDSNYRPYENARDGGYINNNGVINVNGGNIKIDFMNIGRKQTLYENNEWLNAELNVDGGSVMFHDRISVGYGDSGEAGRLGEINLRNGAKITSVEYNSYTIYHNYGQGYTMYEDLGDGPGSKIVTLNAGTLNVGVVTSGVNVDGITEYGKVTMDASSKISVGTINVGDKGRIIIDAAGYSGSSTKVIEQTSESAESLNGKVTVNNLPAGYLVSYEDGDVTIYVTSISTDSSVVGFDSVKVGYSQPEPQTVIITNNGDVSVKLTQPSSTNYVIGTLTATELAPQGTATFTIQPQPGLAVGNYADTITVKTNTSVTADIEVSFLVYQPSSGGSNKPVEEPEEPVVEPEVPTEEPVAGEVTVETEVTDGGEVEFEAPVEEPEAGEVGTPAAEDEAKITGVVLPTGTEGKVEFVPISEQAAPEGKETQTKKVFEINVPTYEKGKPATIKFTMTVAELAADGKEAADVALWHFDEETGEWTKLVTSYTIVDGVVYFEAITNDFSPFAIIYEDEPADEPVEEPETPASPAPVFAVLAALGAAVVLRRK